MNYDGPIKAMAETEGFEPSIRFPVYSLSRGFSLRLFSLFFNACRTLS